MDFCSGFTGDSGIPNWFSCFRFRRPPFAFLNPTTRQVAHAWNVTLDFQIFYSIAIKYTRKQPHNTDINFPKTWQKNVVLYQQKLYRCNLDCKWIIHLSYEDTKFPRILKPISLSTWKPDDDDDVDDNFIMKIKFIRIFTPQSKLENKKF